MSDSWGNSVISECFRYFLPGIYRIGAGGGDHRDPDFFCSSAEINQKPVYLQIVVLQRPADDHQIPFAENQGLKQKQKCCFQ